MIQTASATPASRNASTPAGQSWATSWPRVARSSSQTRRARSSPPTTIIKGSSRMSESSADREKLRRAHPLAISLIARLRAVPHARILEIGSGSGRNTEALEAAGFEVEALADGAQILPRAEYYDGALSTHA